MYTNNNLSKIEPYPDFERHISENNNLEDSNSFIKME